MRPVTAELRPELRPGTWHVGAALVCVVLGLAMLAFGNHRRWMALSAERVAAGELTASSLPVQQSAAAAPLYERSAREFLQSRSHPWPEALTVLERTPFESGVLNAIELDVSSGRAGVAIRVIVPSEQSLVEGIRALNEGQPRDGSGLIWSVERTRYVRQHRHIEAELTAATRMPR